MKKLFLPFLAVLFFAPVHAQTSPERAELIKRVVSCDAIMEEFVEGLNGVDPIPRQVLQRAKAIVIVNQFKAGFVLGIKDGYGVVLAKKANGTWSLPVLVSAGEASLGLQLGAKSDETVMVITDDATPRLLFKQRFNAGVDAKAIAGPRVAEREDVNHPIINAPVLVYTKSKGLYAGATVKTGYISRNDEANRILYSTQYTMPELLYSDWVQPIPEVRSLMGRVQAATK
jgi:lipid-binding SYLF domain-containing protein